MASNIKITFIGTGGSWPTPGRGLPSVAVQIDEIINLFDCGEGSQKQLMKSKISFMSIDNVFLTHFHGDHFLGLIGMVQSMSFNNREKPLNVYGPRGAIRILSSALNVGYYRPKFEIRIGEPLDFAEFRGQPAGARQRRAVTDQVVSAIQKLSGQEFVPVYASVRKEELAAQQHPAGTVTRAGTR